MIDGPESSNLSGECLTQAFRGKPTLVGKPLTEHFTLRRKE